MPMIQVDVPKWDEFKLLKKMRGMKERLADLVKYSKQEKEAKKWLKANRYDIFADLRMAIPDADVKSIEFDGAQVSMITYEKGRDTLDKRLLLTTPFRVKCPCKCGKQFEVLVPASLIAQSTTAGKVPDPTISVTIPGVEDGDE